MKQITNIPVENLQKKCPRCTNVMIIERADDIDVEYVYYSSLFDLYDETVKVPSFFCLCPACKEKIDISKSDLTDYMQVEVLKQNRWYNKFLRFCRKKATPFIQKVKKWIIRNYGWIVIVFLYGVLPIIVLFLFS